VVARRSTHVGTVGQLGSVVGEGRRVGAGSMPREKEEPCGWCLREARIIFIVVFVRDGGRMSFPFPSKLGGTAGVDVDVTVSLRQ
jgi:hypothetical protein